MTKVTVKAWEKVASKSGLKKLVGWIVKASEIAKEAGPFHVFRTLSIFKGLPRPFFRHFFMNYSSISILAGIGVRISKYPYNNICDSYLLKKT